MTNATNYNQYLQNIMNTFQCELEEITSFEPLFGGLTNHSYTFEVDKQKYVYREPGLDTDAYINRESEFYAQTKAKELGLDNSLVFMDQQEGWKISHFIEDARYFDYRNAHDVSVVLSKVKYLHEQNIQGPWEFDLWNKTLDFERQIGDVGRKHFEDYDDIRERVAHVYERVSQEGYPKTLCHNDIYTTNILFQGETFYLIDWEFAMVADPAVDLATFIVCSPYNFEEIIQVLHAYAGGTMAEKDLRHFIGYFAVTGFYWMNWAIFQENNGTDVGDFFENYYKYTKLFLEQSEAYEAR